MDRLTVEISDELWVRVQALALAKGHATVEDYVVARLLEVDADEDDLEAELVRRLDDEGMVEATVEFWSELRRSRDG